MYHACIVANSHSKSGVETLKSCFVKRFFLKCFLYSYVYMSICVM